MIEIWGRRNSSNVMSVLWALGELDIRYERHNVGGSFGGNDSVEYLALNPNGVVPTLRDGAKDDGRDVILFESNRM